MNATADPKATHIVNQWKHDNPLISCRFEPRGRYIFSTSEDFSVQRWSLPDGKRTVLKGHQSWVRGMVFSQDGETAITSGYDDTLIWWPVAGDKLEPIRQVKAHDGWIRALAVSPDGKLLASVGNDLVVRLWSVADGKPVREFKGHEKHIYSALFHSSGEFLMTGDLAGKVIQWETGTGKQVRSFDAKALHTYNGGQRVDYGGVRSIAISPDGKRLACSGLHKATNPLGAVNEPIVVMFDWESGKALKSHIAAGVRGIAWRTLYHPSGFQVCVSGGSGGGFLLFWKPDEEKEFHKLKMPNTAREMDLHSDGIQVATVHHDRHLRISKMAPKAP